MTPVEVVSGEVVPVEVVSLEVAPLEVVPLEVVPFRAVVLHGPTAVTTLETVTANAFCMTRSTERQYDRQCRERHECDSFLQCCCLTSLPTL